ncbi:MAG TPA: hypothetical protein VH374_22600 [Polyangia bacterium]|jgi:hypothetical protein|nr:hypothetical protein [Polyangia bacterium]
MIYRVLDRLAERYGDGKHKLEAMRARAEYFDRAGRVFDDDAELFEGRMAAFLEWYVIERPFDGGPPPAVRALDEDASLSDDERREAALLATSHRSLFELHHTEDGVVDVEDILGGARFTVGERRGTVGFHAGDLFEARVIWDGQALIFGRTFLFHPPDAREVVLDWVEGALARGAARDEILFHLSRQHIRWHRYGHVGAAKIYKGDGGSVG